MNKKIENYSDLIGFQNNFIKREVLKNGIKIFTLNKSLDYDLVIKFKNYGSILDNEVGVYGIQHLLEHCIFHDYKDLNINSNASTNPNYMTLELNFSDSKDVKSDKSLKLLKHWLFTNNDYTRINLARNLSIEEITCYINELHNEYLYRSLLNIPWDLQTFLSTNGDVHYFGGNQYTLKNKEEIIQRYLANPYPINPEDIVIFIKKSKEKYYNEIKNLFKNIVPVKKPKLHIKYNFNNYYNKIIEINNSDTHTITVIVDKSDIDINFFFYLKSLYPFINFDLDVFQNCFIEFTFLNIDDLYNFFILLQTQNYAPLFYNKNEPICYYVNILNLDMFDDDILNNLSYNSKNVLTYDYIFAKYKPKILNFFKMISNKIREKQFILNLTKKYLFNNETQAKEKFFMTNMNFNEEYFYNNFFFNFNLLNYLNLQKEALKRQQHLYCTPIINFINTVNNYKNIKESTLLKIVDNLNSSRKQRKPTLSLYINSLILFFSSHEFISLEDSISFFLRNNFKIIKNKDIDIQLTNKVFKIKTEYNFIFNVIKIRNEKKINLVINLISNLQEYLKRKGLCYYIETSIIKYSSFFLIFIYTNTLPENYTIITNNIKSRLLSYNIKFSFDSVESEKTLNVNFYNIKKDIKYVL